MDAGLLDVLHHGADQHRLPVRDGVDVDLDGVLDEAIDQRRRSDRRARPDRLGVVADAHGTPAEHVARPHQHRVTDPLRGLYRLVRGVGDRPLRGLQPDLGEQRAEPLSILGQIDRRYGVPMIGAPASIR